MNFNSNFDLYFDFQHLKREFIAGGTAGSIGIFIGFPLDLIKVNLQVHPDKFRSPLHCLKETVKESGYLGLYRGCLPPILTQGVINALCFAGESTTMKFLQPELKRGEIGTPVNTYIAGCMGGLTGCIALVPSDVVKCTMQANDAAATVKSDKNILVQTIQCTKNIIKNEGIIGLYKGFGVTAIREVPSIGVYFYTYKYMRDFIWKSQGADGPTTISTLIGGGCAGAASWSVIYPFDVLKTNIQISTVPVAGNKLAYKDMSIAQAALSLYKQHGWRMFFRGLGTTVVRAFPVNASTFYFYELIKTELHLE